MSIVDAQGRTLCTSNGASQPGIHRVQWTLVAPELAGQAEAAEAAAAGAAADAAAWVARRMSVAPAPPVGVVAAEVGAVEATRRSNRVSIRLSSP